MFVTIILWISAFAFISYGLVCFFVPDIPASAIGYSLTNADSAIEIIAMYGGVQIAIGLFSLLGARVETLRYSSLTALMLIYSGLAIGRLYGLVQVAGVATSYTYGAGAFEVVMAVLSAGCLYRYNSKST
jgi:hypothetical protein